MIYLLASGHPVNTTKYYWPVGDLIVVICRSRGGLSGSERKKKLHQMIRMRVKQTMTVTAETSVEL